MDVTRKSSAIYIKFLFAIFIVATALCQSSEEGILPALHFKIQSVPRSKHAACRLYKRDL